MSNLQPVRFPTLNLNHAGESPAAQTPGAPSTFPAARSARGPGHSSHYVSSKNMGANSATAAANALGAATPASMPPRGSMSSRNHVLSGIEDVAKSIASADESSH